MGGPCFPELEINLDLSLGWLGCGGVRWGEVDGGFGWGWSSAESELRRGWMRLEGWVMIGGEGVRLEKKWSGVRLNGTEAGWSGVR